MISYKTWKILQENIGHTNLGVKSPNIIGAVNDAPPFMKKKKPMPGAEGPPDMDAPDMGGASDTDMDDMGDEEGGDEEGGDDDMDDDDHDHDEEDDMGDEEGGDEEGGDDMGDEEGGDDMGDEEGGDDMGDEEGDMSHGGPPMGKKKPPMMGKPPMGGMGGMGGKMSYMKKESMKQKGKGCSKCNKCSKMKEENEFLANLRGMTGGTKFAVDDEGYWVPIDEDVLISPKNKNNDEFNSGEVGFAPTQKLGSNFQEWATKHVKKTRK